MDISSREEGKGVCGGAIASTSDLIPLSFIVSMHLSTSSRASAKAVTRRTESCGSNGGNTYVQRRRGFPGILGQGPMLL
ncbi:unnamed protein product [Penicillium camemberti]|uniref:Str. FM013 n=1 Tax=Penicillium camemberti (strain FM 013) TaxID=1429867 RepID=A0A0G4PI82_PENC3|nr:unnamed protein product [Penicillium camemberti]